LFNQHTDLIELANIGLVSQNNPDLTGDKLTLFDIRASNDDGDDLCLIVRAKDGDAAVKLWTNHYEGWNWPEQICLGALQDESNGEAVLHADYVVREVNADELDLSA